MNLKASTHFSAYKGLPKEIYILFLARVINCMGSFIFPLLTLILTQKMGMTKSETGNFAAFLTLTQAPCLFLGGKLIDTIGRKKVLVVCQVLGSAAYLMCGLVRNHSVMLVLIVVAADLFVAVSPAYQAMVADLTNPENRKASFSLLYLGINIGMAISPILGGLLFQDYLQLLFILDAATTLISTLLITVYIGEVQSRPQPTDSAVKNIDRNTSVFSVLKQLPVLLLFLVFMFSYHFTYTQWNFMLPLQFGDLYAENGARFYSYLNALNALIVVACTPLLTKVTMRLRPLMVIAGGGILYFIAFVSFAVSKSMLAFLVTSAVFTFAEIIVTINWGTFIADHSPSAYLGRVNSFALFLQGTASALAPMVMGRVLSVTNYFAAWSAIALFVLLGAVSMLFLNKKEKKEYAVSYEKIGD